MKEKLYIGEATVATIFGVIVGPHCLNWFAPTTWGNTDFITLEISRIVLIVQIFAVAVELPKKYMLKHWLSVVILLFPVMTFGWLISSVFIWKLVPPLSWVQGLVLAACITATDPVLASAVVGKGKFARRVPGHLRNLLSAESACNDGMAFPFLFLAINLILHAGHHREIAFDFIVITILYECVFGIILGVVIGYTFRHLIKFAENKNLIDRESFLSFYFVLALFCTGVGSIIGVDDLLVSFAAGSAFSWDGWFAKNTEESHVSNVIDLLINMSFFVYFGAIVPWEQFNSASLGIEAWKLVILAILILLFRRLPIVLLMKPFVPDIRSWREAFFCGHFGPIGVGAIFISLLARAELETDGSPTPLAQLPPPGSPNYFAIAAIWPVTTFLVVASILVHGSSIAVFTLGKRLNNLTITMSYTTGGNNQSWLSRLPRLEGVKSLSIHRVDTEEPTAGRRFKFGITSKPSGAAGAAATTTTTKKRTKEEPPESLAIDLGKLSRRQIEEKVGQDQGPQAYQEGDKIIVEDERGEVLTTFRSSSHQPQVPSQAEKAESSSSDETKAPSSSSTSSSIDQQQSTSITRPAHRRQGKKIIAYQLDDDILVENDEGDIMRRYRIHRRGTSGQHPEDQQQRHQQQQADHRGKLGRTFSWIGLKRITTNPESPNVQQSPQPVQDHDLEKQPENDLVLIDKAEDADNQLDVDEDTMRLRLKELLLDNKSVPRESADGPSRTNISRAASGASGSRRTPESHETPLDRGREKEQDEDKHGEGNDDEMDGETEVERKRRLAALGLVEGQNDDNDEEERVAPSSRMSTARSDVQTIPEEEAEEKPGGEPEQPRGIQWRSDVKSSKS